jgi:UDP-N-acetylmuramoyl-L-alanyl-D-glutamate--2,6-diaminopimelate ligase
VLSLTKLIANAGITATITGDAEIAITGITSDSRQVREGSLFVAMPGVVADGTRYIPEALRRGAAAILMATTAKTDVLASVPMVRTDDMRAAASAVAAAFYPRQPKLNFAITGTDGKTSTADFTRQLASLLGHSAASIGTLGLRSPYDDLNAAFPAANTSPEPILLHQMLDAFTGRGGDAVAIEASSHGLDQKRLDGVTFTAGAFTNFGRDHLDYHQTLEAYFEAKAQLFSRVMKEGSTAVINRDDSRFDTLAALCARRNIRVISFGTHAAADYVVSNLTPHVNGLDATVTVRGTPHAISLPLYGAFQLSNMLTAVGLLEAAGKDVNTLLARLPQLQGVPGRLEKIVTHNGAAVFIDYAHTPAALEKILVTLRAHTSKKLHVVFGCGGDRDAGKRPEMGAVAVKFADNVIVTDDNPRSENPATIRAAIMQAAAGATEVADRAVAIVEAMKKLHTGDVLVVAGKGHETTQIIGNQTLHFYDAEHIRKAAEQ